ncbi:MAG TPA: nitroreductase family protein [Acidimicrobiales bacterium]|nr:nitroreductase family protein [Acidimicrobiales bacterium]
MDFREVVRRRRMCRDFSPTPVDPAVLDRLLEAARRAPSAGSSQGWAFLVLERPEDLRRFWEAAADEEWRSRPNLPGLLRAPVAVVPYCSPQVYLDRYSEPDKAWRGLASADRWAVPYWTVDVAFATMLLLLAAADEGLGALFFGRDAEAYERLSSTFGVPPDWQPIGTVLLGWPAGEGGPRGSALRGLRPVDEVVHRGGWRPAGGAPR